MYRVAKIAYYNSKITSSSQNSSAFKANIFQSGMRGNFFSQERLPLRSCKIKVKLKNSCSSLSGSVENLDSFIDYKNNLNGFCEIERNLTLTTQNNVKGDDSQPLEADEIRKFFKDLIVYIPITNAMRLNDVIEENSDMFQSDDGIMVDCIKLIYEIILSKWSYQLNQKIISRLLFDTIILRLKAKWNNIA